MHVKCDSKTSKELSKWNIFSICDLISNNLIDFGVNGRLNCSYKLVIVIFIKRSIECRPIQWIYS